MLRPVNPQKWAVMGAAIDDVLKRTRSPQYDVADRAAVVETLLAIIDTLDR